MGGGLEQNTLFKIAAKQYLGYFMTLLGALRFYFMLYFDNLF